METEGLSFPEAVERLAGEAGVPMPARDAARRGAREGARQPPRRPRARRRHSSRRALQSRAGAAARGYLATAASAPTSSAASASATRRPTAAALKEHLAGKGVTQEQMIEAGLLIAGDDIPVSFDRFRDRVIFPIADFRGRIVGFGGRALAADVPAKYLNSPETELFHKGTLLYNGAEARKAAHDAGTVIAVEGYVDVIRMVARRLRPHRRAARHGADRAPAADPVADGRRADPLLRRRQGRHPRRRPRRRSRAAAARSPGKSLRFALLPEGQDPDDLIRAAGARGDGAR